MQAKALQAADPSAVFQQSTGSRLCKCIECCCRVHLQGLVTPVSLQEGSHWVRQLRIGQKLAIWPQVQTRGVINGPQNQQRAGMLRLRPMAQSVDEALQDDSAIPGKNAGYTRPFVV